MDSKRNSAAAPNMEFLRSENSGKQDKCKEFWKYLDDKKTLQPYQPPKLTEDEKQCTSSSANSRSSCRASVKEPIFPSKGAKPKQSTCGSAVKEPLFPSKGAKPKQPIKKEPKTKKYCGGNSHYEKMFRKNLKLATYDQSFESLLEEIDDYEKRLEMRNTCPICKNVECICKEKGPKEK